MALSSAEDHSKLERVVAHAHPWIETAARLGYIAKGIVYGLIGIYAFLAAMHMGGGEQSQQKAINSIGSMPLGRVFLIPIGVGLIGYALWRILAAILNPENKAPVKRIGNAATGIGYGTIGWAALRLAFFDQKMNTDNKSWTNEFLSRPFGQWLLIGIGLGVIGLSIGQFVNAFTCQFCKVLKDDEIPKKTMAVARWTGRIGLAARGVLFLLIGYFLTRAGWTGRSKDAGGIDEALRATKVSVAGLSLMGVVALGLLCYAVFLFIESRYRKIEAADQELVEEVQTEAT